jgi:hypothetical protein
MSTERVVNEIRSTVAPIMPTVKLHGESRRAIFTLQDGLQYIVGVSSLRSFPSDLLYYFIFHYLFQTSLYKKY